MNKIFKNSIALIITAAFLGLQIYPCAAFSLDLKKNSSTVKTTSKVKNTSKKETGSSRKVDSTKIALLGKNKSTNKVTKKQKNTENKKTKKQGFWARYKAKRQAAKDAESTVTAKTDKNQPSVQIILKNEKEKTKAKKQPKIKQKRFRKPDPKKAKTQEQKPVEINLKEENKPHKPTAAEQQEADAFNASTDDNAKMEAAVSTNRIISVDDCVKIALENNPTILSQLISKDIYKNKIAQAWSNYFPTINAGVSFSRNDMLVTNFRFPMQQYNSWNTPNLGVNLLLYDFGKTRAQAGIAKKSFEGAQQALQANINDVVYQVKSAYYNQLYLQQQVEVYEDSVLQYQIHLKQAQAYYAIGSKAKIDVSTAAYNLDNTMLTLVQAKNSLESGFAQLTNAMGVPEFARFDIKDRLDKKRYDITFDEAFKIAMEQNPTLTAAKKKMEGSKILVRSSKVAFLPDLTGFGSFTQGGKKPDTDYGYQIGAQLSYTNLNLLLLKQQVDEATLTYKKDQADYETQRQKLYLDVKQAYIQLKNAQQSIPVARSSMEVAKERYDLASGRYKVGLGDAIELKDAQIEFVNAKLQYYNTLMQYHISAANLERVIGAPLTTTDVTL